MTADADFYIAWDGKRYFGQPPEHWFLAADNRWWPPREIIDTGQPADDEAAPSAASRPHTNDELVVTPPSHWAPEPFDPDDRAAATPPPPTTATPRSPGRARAGGATTRPARRRRIGVRRWVLLVFLIFMVSRWGLFDSDDATPSLPPITIGAEVENAGPGEPAVGVPVDILVTSDARVTIEECRGLAQAVGTLTNAGPVSADFELLLQLGFTGPAGLAGDAEVVEPVGPVEPGETIAWSAGEPAGQSVIDSCRILSVEPLAGP